MEDLINEIQQSAVPSLTIEDVLELSIIPQGIEVPQPETIFGMGGVPVFTKKSISLLKGQAKAGKTTVTSWITSNIIHNGIKVLWIDTEQGLYYGSRTQFWVLKQAGMDRCDNLIFLDLKIYDPKKRISITETAIKKYDPDLIIVDGIRDFVFDINSPEEATIISGELMRWAEVYDCHILNIIHENKGSGTARGHLGTEMQNKAEIVLKVFRDDEKRTVVEPEYSRGEPIEPFAFERDDRGMPVLVSYEKEINTGEAKAKSAKPEDLPHNHHLDVLNKCFHRDSKYSYTDIQTELRGAYLDFGVTLGVSKVKDFISWYTRRKYLISYKDGTKTMYKMSDEYNGDVV